MEIDFVFSGKADLYTYVTQNPTNSWPPIPLALLVPVALSLSSFLVSNRMALERRLSKMAASPLPLMVI